MERLNAPSEPAEELRPTLRVPERPTTPPNRSVTPSPNRMSENLYFGYGSNLWQHQIAHRCPGAQYLGIGRLRHWRFQINKAGYANVVEAPPAPYSPATTRWLGPLMGGEEDGKAIREDNERVYGFVYRLGEGDEERLDGYENVPNAYTKEWVLVEFWPRTEELKGARIDVKKRCKKVRCLVYVDRNHVEDGRPSGSYIYKMNEGIQDALGEGIPQGYVEECLRKYISESGSEAPYDKLVSVAIEDAMRMGIDVKKLVEAKENELLETKPTGEGSAMVPQEKLVKYLKSLIPDADHGNQDPELKNFTRRRAMSITW